MDNYTILLEQFHIHQKQQAATHQQFAEIVDFIRNEKQTKQSLIFRKKQQKAKLIHKLNKNNQRVSVSTPKISNNFQGHERQQNLEQINNVILKKQHEQLQKQVCKTRKVVKQMQDQLAVFIRKDNQIKQLQYSSRRQLQTVSLEVKNQKTLTTQMQQKYEKLLQQLNIQKRNLQHQNRYLADQLKQMNYLTRNYRAGMQSDVFNSSFEYYRFKVEELYTKKNVQGNLRAFFFVFMLATNWESIVCHKTNFSQLQSKFQKQLHSQEHFCFLSKNQVFKYYLSKFKFDSFNQLSQIVIQLYKRITKNINKNENIGNHLNNKLIELNNQHERLIKLIDNLEQDTHKCTIMLIEQIDRQLFSIRQNVRKKSRSIFQILQRQFKLLDKLKRVAVTLDGLIDCKNQYKTQEKANNTFSFNFNKKLEFILSKKSDSSSLSSLNLCNQSLNGSKTNQFGTNKCINFLKKSSNQIYKSIFSRNQQEASQFQIILYRNPLQIIVQWYNCVNNGRQGVNFLQTILNNDLYRSFFEPQDYDSSQNQLQNQTYCSQKVFESIKKFLKFFQISLVDLIKNIIQQEKNLNEKNKNLLLDATSSLNQPRYVVQSRGYFRRDNFKILQKMQKIELKKQGLYIPFKYGVNVDQQMISERKIINQSKLEIGQKLNKRSLKKPRCSAPDSANYISSYRQKLNKANRKIRDLLTNADNLRVKLKVKRQSSRHQMKKNTETSVIIG